MTAGGVSDSCEPDRTAQVAKRILAEVNDLDCLRGVGYYTPEECNRVFLRDDIEPQVDGSSRLLEDAALESIGLGALEDALGEDMTGMVRVFDSRIVHYYYVADHRGVIVSLDRERLLDYEALHTKLERLVETFD